VLHTELSAEAVLKHDPEKQSWAAETQRKMDMLSSRIRSEIEPVHR
jgi:hypothetical protein